MQRLRATRALSAARYSGPAEHADNTMQMRELRGNANKYSKSELKKSVCVNKGEKMMIMC